MYRAEVVAFGRVLERWYDTGRVEEKWLPFVMLRGGRIVPAYDRGSGFWIGLRVGSELILFSDQSQKQPPPNTGFRDKEAEEALGLQKS